MNEIIKKRRSIRQYDKSKPISKEQLNTMLSAAMMAPSACNTRPWEFIAVRDRDILDRIAEEHPHAKMCGTATAAIIVVAVPQTGIAEGYYPQDCGAATQNILLAAAEMGLGTCWCGVYPKTERMKEIASLFDIKEPLLPFCIIAIGYPDENPEQRGFFEGGKVRYID